MCYKSLQPDLKSNSILGWALSTYWCFGLATYIPQNSKIQAFEAKSSPVELSVACFAFSNQPTAVLKSHWQMKCKAIKAIATSNWSLSAVKCQAFIHRDAPNSSGLSNPVFNEVELKVCSWVFARICVLSLPRILLLLNFHFTRAIFRHYSINVFMCWFCMCRNSYLNRYKCEQRKCVH